MTIPEAIFLLIIGLVIAFYWITTEKEVEVPLEYDYFSFAEKQREDLDFITREHDGLAWKRYWRSKKEGRND